MLIFPLKKEWYEKIKSGQKTIEYREVKPYWTKRLQKELGNTSFEPVHYASDKGCDINHLQCILQLGYTKQRLNAYINKIEVVDGEYCEDEWTTFIAGPYKNTTDKMKSCFLLMGDHLTDGEYVDVRGIRWLDADMETVAPTIN